MLTLQDIPEIVEDLASGVLTWGEAFPLLLGMVEDNDVEVVLSSLPEPLRPQFTASLEALDTKAPNQRPSQQRISLRVEHWREPKK